MTFADRLRTWEEPLVLYEVIPPNRSAPREEIADQAAYVANLLADHAIDAINIPEIRNEERNGNRAAGFMKKYDPRNYGMTIRDVFDGDVNLLVNHATVYEDEAEQEQWLDATYNKFGIDNLVLVGGESSDIDYPGPSVTDTAQLARETASTDTDPCLGGITIPTRRRDGFDEPDRLLAKQAAGIEFFTSQVIYDPTATNALLTDYHNACQQHDTEPAPIFLSFAPITGKKDARFLEWLGVTIPQPEREWILDPTANALKRSVRVAEHTLREILTTAADQGLDVPIGINVEHVMRYNFEASEILLDRLTSLLEWHQLHQDHNETP